MISGEWVNYKPYPAATERPALLIKPSRIPNWFRLAVPERGGFWSPQTVHESQFSRHEARA